MRYNLVIRTLVFLGVVCVGQVHVSQVPAALLASVPDLMLDSPDIFSDNFYLGYDADSDQLTISGDAKTLDDDGIGPEADIVDGTIDIVATVDSNGQLSGGSVTIGGSVPSLSLAGPTLLTGTLSAPRAQFGYTLNPSFPYDRLQFVFIITGGSAASLFSDAAWKDQVGIDILLAHSGLNPFDPFGSTVLLHSISGVADTAPIIPEPATVCIWVFMTLVGIALHWRFRSRRLAPNH